MCEQFVNIQYHFYELVLAKAATGKTGCQCQFAGRKTNFVDRVIQACAIK